MRSKRIVIGIVLTSSLSLTVLVSSALATIETNGRFAQVTDGIYRGPKPTQPEDYEFLKKTGIKTIVDLRTEFEKPTQGEPRSAESAGMNYLHAPIGINIPFAAGTMFPIPKSQVDYSLRLLEDRTLYPIYIHCSLGRDRTGLVVALHRIYFEGWTVENAAKEMNDFGFAKTGLIGLRHYFKQFSDLKYAPAITDGQQ